MKKLLQLLLVVTCVSALQAQAPAAQEAKPAEVAYKMTLKVFEVEDGKKINERSYVFPAVATLAGQRTRSSGFKIGVRTPITVNVNDKDQRQIQYIDVGLNVECWLEDIEGKLTANLSLEMSNFALPDQQEDPRRGGDPVLRQLKQNFRVQISPGKPVLLTSLDDINSKKRTQIEVTATKFE